jgi:hypothetical protein
LRVNVSRECGPDDRLREAIQSQTGRLDFFAATTSGSPRSPNESGNRPVAGSFHAANGDRSLEPKGGLFAGRLLPRLANGAIGDVALTASPVVVAATPMCEQQIGQMGV